MRAKLRCRISAGQFSSECAIVVQNFNGRSFSLFAPKTELTYDEAPTDENCVEGWIAVDVLNREGNLYLIRLPQTTLESGRFLTVRAEKLDRVPDRATVA